VQEEQLLEREKLEYNPEEFKGRQRYNIKYSLRPVARLILD